MSNFDWVSPIDGPGYPVAAGAAFSNFTTFQDISPVPIPTLRGGTYKVGSIIELEAEGEFSTTGTPTLQLGFYYGAVTVLLAASAAITAGTATAWPWHMRWRGKVISLGTAGTILGTWGVVDLGTSLTAFASQVMPITQAARTVTVDTTTNKVLGVGAAWGAASASNTIKVNNYSALILN